MSVEVLKNRKLNYVLLCFRFLIICLWMLLLSKSDSYVANYIILFFLGVLSLFANRNNNACDRREKMLISIFSIGLSLMVCLSNYNIGGSISLLNRIARTQLLFIKYCIVILIFFGSYIVFKNILTWIKNNYKSLEIKRINKDSKEYIVVFFVSFIIIVTSRLIVLLCQYPGVLTIDSVNQITQIMTGDYSNHHPFWHTMVIKLFVEMGLRIFNDINKGVALYSIAQIILSSLSFAFAASTLSRMKVSRKVVALVVLFFTLMPYHLMYSITMWKDVLFGCFVLLFITVFYRIFVGIGNNTTNYILLIVSSIGICLFRSNGFFVFVILTVVLFLLWKMKYKKVLFVFLGTIVLSTFLKHTTLSMLHIEQPDTIEALSIPAQQIARVVKENKPLNEWERDMLEEIIDLNQVGENYSPYISNPIKHMIRDKGNQQYLSNNKKDYLKLYIDLGCKYPTTYVKAWVDQTRGYWNSGYEYWRWRWGVVENDYGIERTVMSSKMNNLLKLYTSSYQDINILKPFVSIGLFVWINIIMMFIAIIKKEKESIFVSLPNLAIVLSLLIATPVFSEFRYIYALFCSIPMIIVIVLLEKNKRSEDA